MIIKLPLSVLVLAGPNLPVNTFVVVTVENVGKDVFMYLVMRSAHEFCFVGTHVQEIVQKTARHVKESVHTSVSMANVVICAILYVGLAPIDVS